MRGRAMKMHQNMGANRLGASQCVFRRRASVAMPTKVSKARYGDAIQSIKGVPPGAVQAERAIYQKFSPHPRQPEPPENMPLGGENLLSTL